MRRFQAEGISDASSLGSCEVIRNVANGLFYRLHCAVVLVVGFRCFSPLLSYSEASGEKENCLPLYDFSEPENKLGRF